MSSAYTFSELTYRYELKGPYICEYEYRASLSSRFMATAIVSAYTPEGFVIGADGLRREGRTRNPVSETATKIFSIEDDDKILAHAWAGATNLFNLEGKSFFDVLRESAKVGKILASPHIDGFAEYVGLFMDTVHQRLLSANTGDRLSGDLNLFPKGEEVARVLFVGYFNGIPYRAQSAIVHRDYVLIGPRLSEFRQAPVDFNVFSGSAVMLEKFKPRLTDAPNTLSQAATLVRDYIQTCIDNQHDRECEDIGGHIHIAAVTPKHFEWITAPIKRPG